MEIDSSILQLLVMIALSAVYYFIKKPKKEPEGAPHPEQEDRYDEYDPYNDDEIPDVILEETPTTLRKNVQKTAQNATSPFLNDELSSINKANKYQSKFQKLEPVIINNIADNEIGREEDEEEFHFDPEIAVVYSEILKRPYN